MASDSNKRKPGDRKPAKRPDPAPADDDAIGFRHHEPAEQTAAALSSAGYNPTSGSSILSWNEIVRQQSPDDDIGVGQSEPPIEFDTASVRTCFGKSWPAKNRLLALS